MPLKSKMLLTFRLLIQINLPLRLKLKKQKPTKNLRKLFPQ